MVWGEVDKDDPLALFSGSAGDDACIGEWKNEHLQVRIALQGSRLVLQSAKKELILTRAGFNEWSVADDIDHSMIVYVARVSGYGRDTRLILRPPKHKASDKEAVLRRLEHVELEESQMGLPALEDRPLQDRGHRMDSPEGDDRAPLAIRDREEAEIRRRRRHASPRRGPGGGGRRQGHGRSRSPYGSRSLPRKDEDGAEVTTLFVTGLPNDAREEEVRASLVRAGNILRVVMMRRGQGECNAFVRFEALKEARRAMDRILDGRLEVCQTRVKAEMARRNTN
mmetsp:Transcript_51513/g.149628  ORF Transcript_51513/g.149628 Transcript_51513/m.149628 type:complete len:282 (-) Transcript_51513:134-979(-)